MSLLWTVNLIPSNAASKLQISSDVLGGWVEAMLARLKEMDVFEITVACKCEGAVFDEVIDGVRYLSLNYENDLDEQCKWIIEEVKPDIVHIEGTEFPHSKAMLFAAKSRNIPAVVSMQGILNGQYNYQCGQLQIDDMMFSRSATNIAAAWLLHLRKTRWYAKRMPAEREIIESADFILGRTTWDRAWAYRINPGAKYFSVNRTLRDPFYRYNWNVENIERHSIYVGNGYYALKGAHNVIMALPELICEYPDVKLYIAGHKPFEEHDKRSFFKRGYGAYLKKLINDLGVGDHIVFTGPLKAEQVAERLAKTHVYVLSSAIENSPNTLGEAMMIGTPCVAAYVGGVPDMAIDGKEALFFRNDDPALLAWQIKKVFDDDDLACELSSKARTRARFTHDPEKNASDLIKCYCEILEVDNLADKLFK